MTALAWGNRVSPEFRARVLKMAESFGWTINKASWLMACMHFESGGTFSPSIRNAAGSGATGLIQFMPRTAVGLGTTVDELGKLSAVQQLDYVEQYFKPYAKRINSVSDMYMAILLPSAIGKPEDAPLFSGGTAYRQNSGLDANSDGIVTKGEAARRILSHLESGLKPGNFFDMTSKETTVAPFLALAVPALINALPEFAKIFKKEDVAERNVEAVQKAAEIVINATASTNVQEAVEKVQADPEAASTANNALRMSRAEILDILERAWDRDDKSTEDARTFSREDKPVVGRWLFVHLLSILLVLMGGGAAIAVLFTSNDQTERAMALQALLLVGFASVVAFWLGSSRSSQVKDMIK